MKQRTSKPKNHGFALVATVSMMVLMTLIAIGMLSLSTIEQRSSGGGANDADRMARANARMALMIAIGELQKAAGPDQRVSATASILGDSSNNNYAGGTTAVDGRKHWLGVWDTSSYSPATPDAKTFVRWLVSGDQDELDTIADAGTAASAADMVIFEGVDASGNPDPDGPDSVKVPKVEVATTSGNTSYYAYWVEDEGVKTDLKWEEVDAASASDEDEERAQARRLSAAAAPNYWLTTGGGALGPFRDPNDDGSATDAIGAVFGTDTGFPFDAMQKAMSLEDVSLVAGGTAAHKKWLKGVRHTMSINNRGVLSDTKKGGLRRDLSLAFEMDGDADVTASEQPSLFNQQDGEFVGGADRLAAPTAAAGMGSVKERFLYRDYHGSGTPFSNDIQDVTYNEHQTVVRGPNWWAVRDYYNLYKRLKGTSGNYSLDARAYYPNASVGDSNYHYGSMHGVHNARTWDAETYKTWRMASDRYIFKPARATYAPILLGQSAVFSVLATNSDGIEADLSLGVDPFFFLWNPYNRKLQVNNYAAVLTTWPGSITFEVVNASGTTRIGPATISKFFQQQSQFNEGGEGHFTTLSYHLASPLTMEPGEIIVLSPKSGRDLARANQFHDELYPGTNTDNASGAILKEMPVVIVGDNPNTVVVETEYIDWDPVKLNLANDTVRFLHTTQYLNSYQGAKDTNMSEHCWTHVSMPPPGTLPINAWKDGQRGEHLQQIGGNAAGDRGGPWPELFRPGTHARSGGTLPPFSGSSAANTLVNTKRFFGMGANLLKPTAHERRDEIGNIVYANPVEGFTQFNPYRMAGYSDMWRPCLPNECYTGISDPGDIDLLLLDAGIQWPASFPDKGFWGKSYSQSGTTSVPMSNIPSSPMLSLAALNHANFGVGYWHPFHSVGNSWASVHVSPSSVYGPRPAPNYMGTATAHDVNWLLNDALFDRYYFSGIVPEYSIGAGGYNQTGSLQETLNGFYGVTGDDFKTAQASPVMEPYIPSGKTSAEVVAELLETDLDDAANETPGYKKMAAYSMLKGGFNINCTDADAWGRFLQGCNGDLSVKFSDGTIDSRSDYMGFPSSTSPTPATGTSNTQTWSGWSRLTENEIEAMASAIANEVKARGPFMSVSDFVNHKVGGASITDQHYKGAIQAGIDAMVTNDNVATSAGGLTPSYTSTDYFTASTAPVTEKKSTIGIPGSITQANVLLALAPRLTARSDTFRVRGYGEVRDADDNIIARAICEAVVQRLPEYVDTETDPNNNEPWDEGDILNDTNKIYGRRFDIQNFRWLDESEI
jgi:Tfp pilus assembly protein PilX